MTSTVRSPTQNADLPLLRARLDKLRRLKELKAEEARRSRPPRPDPNRFVTPGELAALIDSETIQTPALDIIDQAVAWAYSTPGARLLVSMPPQEGKSQRVTKTGSLWALTRNPDTRLGIVSYSQPLAEGFGRDVRNWISNNDGTEGTFDVGLRIAADYGSAKRWQLAGYRGGLVCVGIGGGLTGRPLDCFIGSTRVLTDRGYTCIRDIYQSEHPVQVLSWNHTEQRTEWKPVVAARRIADREVVEVVTTSGRRFTCTPDHRIYTADGYREAALLRPGDRLLVGRREPAQTVRGVREGAQVQEPNLRGLLPGSTGVDMVDLAVQPVRFGVPTDASGAREEAQEGPDEPLLFFRVRGGIATHRREAVPVLRQTDGLDGPTEEVLLGGMPGGVQSSRETEVVSAMRGDLRILQQASRVLHEDVRGHGTFHAHDWHGELALQGWHQLCDLVPEDATADSATRPAGLPRMPSTGQAISGYSQGANGDAVQPSCASHRRATLEQSPGEPDPALQVLPLGASQVGEDSVLLVRPVRGERHDVYDIQVAGNSNFFAEEVLVHNCLVIDDPFADASQAASSYYRDRVWNWWQSVGSTRLAPGAPVICILTRWHEDDIAGRFLAAEDGSRWRVVNIPALADHDPAKGEVDPLGRQPGQWLTSARGRTDAEWEQIRIQAGTRVFNALYQGRPSPDAGNVWQRPWWRRYTIPLWSQHPTTPDAYWIHECDEVAMSWDMAFKDTKSSDYVVGQVWIRRGADVYLVDQIHKRLSFTDTLTAFQSLVRRWPQATAKYVEDKANGTAVINTLKSKIPGIVAVTPTESKYARANAVAPLIEAGNVHLPDPGIALFDPEGLIDEAAGFPNGAHDDQVDATSQALSRLLLDGTGAQAWIDYARRRAEALDGGSSATEQPPAPPQPEASTSDDPVAARKRVRDAAYRQQR